jgi:hypothetical protein
MRPGRLPHRRGRRAAPASTFEELAEIAECAIAASDRIELLRARTPGWRLLSHEEFGRFVRLLASRLD